MTRNKIDRLGAKFVYVVTIIIILLLIISIFTPIISRPLGAFNTWVILPILVVMGVFTFFQNRKIDKMEQDLAKMKTISENIEKLRREKSEKADR